MGVAYAAEVCGAVRPGQYADEQLCASIAVAPDGRPAATLDGVPDSVPWIFPADAAGEAVLTLAISPAQEFSTLQFANGWAYDGDATAGPAVYAAHGRVREITVETSDGRGGSFTLDDTPELQFLDLGGAGTADWVRLTVVNLYPGSKDLGALRWLSVAWEADQ